MLSMLKGLASRRDFGSNRGGHPVSRVSRCVNGGTGWRRRDVSCWLETLAEVAEWQTRRTQNPVG